MTSHIQEIVHILIKKQEEEEEIVHISPPE